MRSKRALSAAIEALEFRRLLATITVNTTSDDLTGNDGSVSLREAITAINLGNDLGDPDITAQNPGAFGTADTIHFNIPGTGVHTINVGSSASAPALALPILIKPMVIDATTQPGFDTTTHVPIIELNGTSGPQNSSGDGFAIDAGSSTIRGFVINDFGADGIYMQNKGGNTIAGNYIGTDSAGATAKLNQAAGIEINSKSSGNTIGGLNAGDGNVISGNAGDGVSVRSQSNDTVLLGNFIGTDAAGGFAVPNVHNGVSCSGANIITVGGTAPGSRNLVSGNGGDGLDLENDNGGSALVQGNFIGTDITGTTSIPNGMIGLIVASNKSLVGGTDPAARNVISGNAGDGLQVGSEAVNVDVQGNYIGTDVTGKNPLGNFGDGVAVNECGEIRIGGPIPEAANIIAFNDKIGVEIKNGSDTVLVRLNSIHDNGGIGIDLGNSAQNAGVTPNDKNDVDTGDNSLQNFPVLASAVSNSSGTTIQGSINTNSNVLIVIDLYSNTAFDPTLNGEGETYVGSVSVTTDSFGNANFNQTFPVASLAGQYLSATATKMTNSPNGETSEFSQDIKITAPPDKPLHLIASSDTLAVEGKGFFGHLAHFSDFDPGAIREDFTATIDWGDGTPAEPGFVNPDAAGGFDVDGGHTYAEEGNYSLKITVNDTAGRDDAGGSSLVVTAGATVADAAIHASGKTLSGKEGRLLSATVASFTDDNTAAPVNEFTSTIDWGDGHTTAGTIVSDGAGKFHVTGGHAYEEQSSGSGYKVKVNITDVGGSQTNATSIAKIADALLDQGTGKLLQVNANTTFTNLTLGTFRDQDSLNTKPSDYSGTISWGDGKTSTVKFVANGSTFNVGSFWKVQGSHKYAAKKTYTVKITLFDVASPGAKLVITSTIKAV